MGDLEPNGNPPVSTPPTMASNNTVSLGCSLGYLFSAAGLIRLITIGLGALAFGLWVSGYQDEFLGSVDNQSTGDTTDGYGCGSSNETLNEFVLAAIIIAFAVSVLLLLGLVLVQHAYVDWNRINKLTNLTLSGLMFIALICGCFGVWYYQENCCHIDMELRSGTVHYVLRGSGEGYVRHCNCYVTKYLGHSNTEEIINIALFDPNNVDSATFSDSWSLVAHHIYYHVAALVIICVNMIMYLLAFRISKPLKS